jgi:putative ABC transport system permease protein
VLPTAAAESIVADLAEEQSGHRHSVIWFWAQFLRIAFRCMWHPRPASRARRRQSKAGIEGLVYDIRFAVRSLATNPRTTIVALLTIILTVGGVTCIFTVVHSVLLKPLPYPDSDRLVQITQDEPRQGWPQVSLADFLDLQRTARSFSELAAFNNFSYELDVDSDPQPVELWRLTPEVFSLSGTQPILGRLLLPADSDSSAPIVGLISYPLWQSRFGGKEDAIGRALLLPQNGHIPEVAVTIIGVMPSGFELPGTSGFTDQFAVWSALHPNAIDLDRTNQRSFTVLGRLRPRISVAAAQRELDAFSAHLSAIYPESNKERTAHVALLLDKIVGDTARTLWIFLAAVVCVLLIGVANLVNLQLVRNAARERELAIRSALGGERLRLIRQLVLEGLLLSMTGGAIALCVAWAGTAGLLAASPIHLPRASEVGVDAPVFGFAFLLSLTVGLVFGVIPAWRTTSPDLQSVVSEGSRSATPSGRRLRIQRFLIALETGLALVLLVGALLLTNSFWRLYSQNDGLHEKNLWSVSVSLPPNYKTQAQQDAFWRTAFNQIRSLPQVESASAMAGMSLLSGADMIYGGMLAGGSSGTEYGFHVPISIRAVADDFFKTLDVPVMRGRTLRPEDNNSGQRVAVLNQVAARLLFPSEEPVGNHLVMLRDRMYTVVGVVDDFKNAALKRDVAPQLYIPYFSTDRLSGGLYAGMVIRTRLNTAGFPQAFQSLISGLETKATTTVATMGDVRWKLVAMERFQTAVLLGFAAVAVFLAVVGIFGLVSYSVIQRSREIGLRMALGADAGNVVHLMIRQAMIPVLVGIVAGTAGAFAVSRVLSSYLFQVKPGDPATLAAAALVFVLTAWCASYAPARKASRIDPMSALRHD